MDHADVDAPADVEKVRPAFTPGPWFANGGDIYIDTREQVCCGRPGDECCGQPEVRGDYELIAECGAHNSRLIASAPELFEALTRFVEAHDDYCAQMCVEFDDPLSDAVKQARAALLKASPQSTSTDVSGVKTAEGE